jgi:hypothetical protein
MGNNISTTQTGGGYIEQDKFINTINEILTSLLDNDMELYLDKAYCKKIKFFVKL